MSLPSLWPGLAGQAALNGLGPLTRGLAPTPFMPTTQPTPLPPPLQSMGVGNGSSLALFASELNRAARMENPYNLTMGLGASLQFNQDSWIAQGMPQPHTTSTMMTAFSVIADLFPTTATTAATTTTPTNPADTDLLARLLKALAATDTDAQPVKVAVKLPDEPDTTGALLPTLINSLQTTAAVQATTPLAYQSRLATTKSLSLYPGHTSLAGTTAAAAITPTDDITGPSGAALPSVADLAYARRSATTTATLFGSR